ncbi:hypothetical protein SAMN05444682_102548 [Parapedobacter indicus]|uniref:Uncharacterized protein n=1 Tax=Parapedobacter indicus TaxID=1477437 RepID=A0A1I3FXQ7_9SPHI|nr:hypothetical protein CLV26_102548 [Parapedobacter indicus]SFI16028.1 hypothetical protein SAMN05444682_102548 [Parapedobacter indicus]
MAKLGTPTGAKNALSHYKNTLFDLFTLINNVFILSQIGLTKVLLIFHALFD